MHNSEYLFLILFIFGCAFIIVCVGLLGSNSTGFNVFFNYM